MALIPHDKSCFVNHIASRDIKTRKAITPSWGKVGTAVQPTRRARSTDTEAHMVKAGVLAMTAAITIVMVGWLRAPAATQQASAPIDVLALTLSAHKCPVQSFDAI